MLWSLEDLTVTKLPTVANIINCLSSGVRLKLSPQKHAINKDRMLMADAV